MDVTELPFNQFLGLVQRQSDSGLQICLQPKSEHLNHLGTVHATVLYGMAEAASGAILSESFPILQSGFLVVLRGSTTKYRLPANSDLELVASARIDTDETQGMLERLELKGRAMTDIQSIVVQNETEVFSATFRWCVQAVS